MDLTFQDSIGALAFLIRAVASGIYIVSILKGDTKPHLYTWLVFTLLTAIAFLAQIQDGGGMGIWTTGLAILVSIINSLLALSYGEKNITKSDKLALIAATTSILPWLLTQNPLGSVILVSLIDTIAMYPTFRKSWSKPQEENLTSYFLVGLAFLLSTLALTHISVTTFLYPIAIAFINLSLIFLCLWRRHVLKSPKL